MLRRRWFLRALAIIPLAGGLGGCLARPPAPSATPQVAGRREHTATLLGDGTILVVGGGSRGSYATAVAERYDPRTGLWHDAGRLSAARRDHTASLLPDGSVLIVGGVGDGFLPWQQWRGLATVERYQPTTNRWTTVAPLPVATTDHSAVVLANGGVLVAGGRDQDAVPYRESAAVWRYDPAQDRWAALAPLQTPRFRGTGVALAGGRALVIGGTGPLNTDAERTAEVYDPQSGMWQRSPLLPLAFTERQATALADGRVLAVRADKSVLYDPRRDAWSPAAAVAPLAFGGTLTALPDGRALLVAYTIEGRYDPAQDRWQLVQRAISRTGQTATPLPDGRIVLIGGQDIATIGSGHDVEIVQP